MKISTLRPLTQSEHQGFLGCVFTNVRPTVFTVESEDKYHSVIVIADDEMLQIHHFDREDVECYSVELKRPVNRLLLEAVHRLACDAFSIDEFIGEVKRYGFDQVC